LRFFDYLESAISFRILATALGRRNWSFRQGRGQGCILWNVEYRMKSLGKERPGSAVDSGETSGSAKERLAR